MDNSAEAHQWEKAKTARNVGILLMLISALVFSSAGLFTKGVSADAWSVIFWRGLFASLFTACYVFWMNTGRVEFVRMGKVGIVVALLSASGSAAFIPAFKLTSIANVTLIYGIAPFVAAAISWLFFGQKTTLIVIISSLSALLGVVIIVAESIGKMHMTGDLLALWMTLMMASVMVVYRRFPLTPAAGPAALSSLLLLPPALYFSEPFSESITEIAIMAGFGLIFAIASVTMSEAARRLPSAEAALISSVEIPLAPLWAWMLFAESPTSAVITGGTIVLMAVLLPQVLALRSKMLRVRSMT